MHLTFSPEAGDEFGNRLRVIAPLFGFPVCGRGLPPPFFTLASIFHRGLGWSWLVLVCGRGG